MMRPRHASRHVIPHMADERTLVEDVVGREEPRHRLNGDGEEEQHDQCDTGRRMRIALPPPDPAAVSGPAAPVRCRIRRKPPAKKARTRRGVVT